MRFYVNTDTVDIKNRQIGIHFERTLNREFCAGVNHSGTKESVNEATKIARLFATAPDLLGALKLALTLQDPNDEYDNKVKTKIKQLIAKVEEP